MCTTTSGNRRINKKQGRQTTLPEKIIVIKCKLILDFNEGMQKNNMMLTPLFL